MTSPAPSRDWTQQALVEGLRRFGVAPALITVRGEAVETLSYAALLEKVISLAAGLAASGIESGETVALVAANGCDWVVTRLALAAIGTVVAAFDHLSTEADLRTALVDSGVRRVIADAGQAAIVHTIDPTLDIIVIGEGAPPTGTRGWRELFMPPSAIPPGPSPDLPALLTYTSGTTGAPKGFFLGHAQLWANIDPLAAAGLIGNGDRVLLPLPLHHIYPFLVGLLTPLSVGAAIVFPEAIGGPQLAQAMRAARVTAIVGVPRLYAALASAIAAQVTARGRGVGMLFRLALAASIGARRRLGVDIGRRLFRRARASIAPDLRLLVSGGAHLDPETLWLLTGLGFDVRSGYGLAETASTFTGNLPGAARLESEGKPFQGGSMRIAAPDEEGIGEIELLGPNVFSGYRNNPVANRDAFTPDGWFRTGDLGRIDADGFLFVTGRLKETLVLGGGKKVNPEALEQIYGANPYIREIAVLERQGSLVALVLPNLDALRMGPSARIDKTIRITIASQSQRLPSYERLAGFALVREPLPRTRLGKYRRFLLPSLYERALSGAAPSAPTVPSREDEILLARPRARRLYDFLAARYRRVPIRLDANLQLDLGIDSLEWVSLSLALEQAGLGLAESEFTSAGTVRDLLRAAAAQGATSQEEKTEEAEREVLKRRWLEPTSWLVSLVGCVLYVVNRVLMRVLFRLRVDGIERLPPRGPYVLVANHGSDLDGLVIIAALPYHRARRIYWGGDAVRLFTRRWLHPLWRALHVFPADDRLPGRTLALAEAVLARGNDLTWFPEGWRTPDGRLQHFQPGIGRLLARTRAVAVPLYVSGSFEALPRDRLIPRLRRIRVLFGEPFTPEVQAAADEGALHQRISQQLFDAVATLEQRAHTEPR